MSVYKSVVSVAEPDPTLMRRAAMAKRACLWVVAIVAALNLAAWLLAGLNCAASQSAALMQPDCAVAALLCALGFHFAERHGTLAQRVAATMAFVVFAASATALAGYWLHGSYGLVRLLPAGCGSQMMLPQTAAAFALLAACIPLSGATRRFAIQVADLVVFALCLLTLILVSGYLFGELRVFGLVPATPVSPQSLLCLALLAQVAFLLRARKGIFSIFMGSGIGSKIARVLMPCLVILPFLREVGRAHMITARLIPPHYATAILASIATMLSLVLLLGLAWYINGMETQIRGLSLRDELTGLYNLRGFSLLAEQALRLAHRSQMPFSVLFLDLDNLKQINDSLGHQTGSALLAETAQLLRTTFREADVMGRVGGDEFAVAGHFTEAAIFAAGERLRAAADMKNSFASRRFPINFSLGHATAEDRGSETLKDLLTAADRAMYEEKRTHKTQDRVSV